MRATDSEISAALWAFVAREELYFCLLPPEVEYCLTLPTII